MKSTLEERHFAEMEVTPQSWNPTRGSPALPANAPLQPGVQTTIKTPKRYTQHSPPPPEQGN